MIKKEEYWNGEYFDPRYVHVSKVVGLKEEFITKDDLKERGYEYLNMKEQKMKYF